MSETAEIKSFAAICLEKGLTEPVDRAVKYLEAAEEYKNQFSPQEVTDEAIEIIELLMWYGSIHTITGVVYPQGTHEQALKRAANYLNKNRKLTNKQQ